MMCLICMGNITLCSTIYFSDHYSLYYRLVYFNLGYIKFNDRLYAYNVLCVCIEDGTFGLSLKLIEKKQNTSSY